jgi:Flp pilus assembly protein TadG
VPGNKRRVSRFLPRNLLHREDGSATVETVLWLPLFFAAFGLMTDAAMVFNGHSRVTRILQDANRNLSVGRFVDEDETETYILAALNALAPNATASTTVTAGVATSVVQVPATDLEILGMFSALNSLTLTITSQQYLEF